MNDIRMKLPDKFRQITERPPNVESLSELPSHQQFFVTGADDLTALYPLDLRSMGIRNSAATDDGNPKHGALLLCNTRSTSASLALSSQEAASVAPS